MKVGLIKEATDPNSPLTLQLFRSIVNQNICYNAICLYNSIQQCNKILPRRFYPDREPPYSLSDDPKEDFNIWCSDLKLGTIINLETGKTTKNNGTHIKVYDTH